MTEVIDSVIDSHTIRTERVLEGGILRDGPVCVCVCVGCVGACMWVHVCKDPQQRVG